jgi:DNA processing protein
MSQDREHVRSWIGLSSIPGIGRVTFRSLVAHFGSARCVLEASQEELRENARLSEKVSSTLRSFPWQERADEELVKADAAGVAIITAIDQDYPGPLLKTPDPPLLLYVKGSLVPEDGNAVAMVGTRTPTHYGLTVTHRGGSRS